MQGGAGMFWLRRLTKAGQEPSLRAAAFELLARLAGPSVPGTSRALLQGWPTCASAVMQVCLASWARSLGKRLFLRGLASVHCSSAAGVLAGRCRGCLCACPVKPGVPGGRCIVGLMEKHICMFMHVCGGCHDVVQCSRSIVLMHSLILGWELCCRFAALQQSAGQ